MPLFDDLTSKLLPGTHYGYSGTRIDRLGASEYTLVAIATDASGSVGGFRKEITACIGTTLEACRQAPRADNLMVRITQFGSSVKELQGFAPLHTVKTPSLSIGGTTALYDAAVNAVAATTDYARDLVSNGLSANAIVFVITDGGDNASTLTASRVADAVRTAVADEYLESVVTVLIGVNVADAGLAKRLMTFSAEAGFDHYLELAKADAGTLARLADFLSRSIAAQSRVLGTGGPSQVLSF